MAEPQEQRRVFISYAREDQESAERLYRILSGYPELAPWMDKFSLKPGSEWPDEITSAMAESATIILLLSERSVNKRGYVQRETRDAIDLLQLTPPGSGLVIPIRLDACQPKHRFLTRLTWIDLFPGWDDGLDQLLLSFGLRYFTHRYVALGTYKTDVSTLIALDDPYDVPPAQTLLVNLHGIPPIDPQQVRRTGLARSDAPLGVFIQLWSTASGLWPASLYRKGDWNNLDSMLYSRRRSDDDAVVISSTIRRLWAVAGQLDGYVDDDWRTLRRLALNF